MASPSNFTLRNKFSIINWCISLSPFGIVLSPFTLNKYSIRSFNKVWVKRVIKLTNGHNYYWSSSNYNLPRENNLLVMYCFQLTNPSCFLSEEVLQWSNICIRYVISDHHRWSTTMCHLLIVCGDTVMLTWHVVWKTVIYYHLICLHLYACRWASK